MKVPYTQKYEVILTDGTVVEACCGPAIPLKARFLQTIGEPIEGICCHHQPPNLSEPILILVQTNHLQEGLKHLETMETIKDKLTNKWAQT